MHYSTTSTPSPDARMGENFAATAVLTSVISPRLKREVNGGAQNQHEC